MNIDITVRNINAKKQYILVFQKPENTVQMFDTLFPVAWKILPLSSGQDTSIVYPLNLQISVKDYQDKYDAKVRGTIKDTEPGKLWSFINEGDFTVIRPDLDADEAIDGLIGCINKTPAHVDIGIAKDGSNLLIQRKVPQNDRAQFKLTPKLYFTHVHGIYTGDLLKSDVAEGDGTFEVSLTNLKKTTVEISVADESSGNKIWTEKDRILNT